MRIRGRAHTETASELKEWAVEIAVEGLRCELATHTKSTKAGEVESEVVNEASLKKLTFDATSEEVQTNAPQLYNTLMKICESPRQEKHTQKDAKFSVILLINPLAYQLSHNNNRMQKLICMYFEAKGVPKSCFFFFQKAGLQVLMSYEWSRKALEQISAAAMEEAAAVFENCPCIAMHDNIRLSLLGAAAPVAQRWGTEG